MSFVLWGPGLGGFQSYLVLESLGEEEYVELREIDYKYVVFETPNQTYFSLTYNG